MSKYCPIFKRNVVYLECLECDDKLCEKEEDAEKSKEKDTDKRKESPDR